MINISVCYVEKWACKFAFYKREAEKRGFLLVSSSPLTRSSYHAGDDFKALKAARSNQSL